MYKLKDKILIEGFKTSNLTLHKSPAFHRETNIYLNTRIT